MNILLIYSEKNSCYPEQPLEAQIHIHLGLSLIGSLLMFHGHAVQLLVLCRKTAATVIDEYIDRFQPRLIGFTAVYTEYDFLASVAERLKARFNDIFLLAGGPHVTLNPEATIGDAFDAICIGEGEYPTLELVKQLENGDAVSGIPNLWIKHRSSVEKNTTRPFIQNLDSLPFAARAMWQPWIRFPDSVHTVLLGRGCPYLCTYCCNHALRKIAPGKYVRIRSVDNVMDEVKTILQTFPNAKTLYFEVETIGINIDYAEELCTQLVHLNSTRQELLSFGINLRIIPCLDYDRLFSAMQAAHFTSVNIGLESGSETVRREILRRDYSNIDYYHVVSKARQYGLKVRTYVLIGIPGETRADFRETIHCMRQSQPDEPLYSIFFPYPGTALHEYCKNKGLLPQKLDTRTERYRATLSLPGFSRRQIQRQHDWFYFKVYRGHRSWQDICSRTWYQLLESSYFLSFCHQQFSALRWSVARAVIWWKKKGKA